MSQGEETDSLDNFWGNKLPVAEFSQTMKWIVFWPKRASLVHDSKLPFIWPSTCMASQRWASGSTFKIQSESLVQATVISGLAHCYHLQNEPLFLFLSLYSPVPKQRPEGPLLNVDHVTALLEILQWLPTSSRALESVVNAKGQMCRRKRTRECTSLSVLLWASSSEAGICLKH